MYLIHLDMLYTWTRKTHCEYTEHEKSTRDDCLHLKNVAWSHVFLPEGSFKPEPSTVTTSIRNIQATLWEKLAWRYKNWVTGMNTDKKHWSKCLYWNKQILQNAWMIIWKFIYFFSGGDNKNRQLISWVNK